MRTSEMDEQQFCIHEEGALSAAVGADSFA
jgi:hypothetical protein